jgi:hypothetical protein
MKKLIQLSNLSALMTVLILFSLIFFQIYKLSTLSSEVDDIGVFHTLVEAQNKKNEFNLKINTTSQEEIINEINKNSNEQTKKLASYLQIFHILEPTLKFIANYKFIYSVPMNWTYAPGQYFITQNLVNGDESYQTAKLKIRSVSKFLWFLGIIGMLLILSKIKNKNTMQASLLFMVLIVCAQSQTSYSAHGSSYASGLFASSLVTWVIIKLFNSKKLSIIDIIFLLIATLIQYQLIPMVFLTFVALWVRAVYLRYVDLNVRHPISYNLFNYSIIFSLLFFTIVFPTFKNKIGSGLNWNAGIIKEYSLNDNYSELISEFAFVKFTKLLIEVPNAFVDTIASIYSPFSYSATNAKIIGIPIIVLIYIAITQSIKNKILRPYIAASSAVLLMHFLLYVLGKIPFSPTRHSLYLTVPFTILGVIGLINLIDIIENWYPKLIKSIMSVLILIIVFFGGYLNINYIFQRNDPFDDSKVEEIMASSETPVIVINSDSTYQHYEMVQARNNKILLDLNLQSKRDKFSEELEKIRPLTGTLYKGDTIQLMRVSHWSSLDNKTENELVDIICNYYNYKCIIKSNHQLFSSTEKVASEWVGNIQGFSNSLFVNSLSISVVNSKLSN